MAWAERYELPSGPVLRWFERADRAPSQITLRADLDPLDYAPEFR